MIRGAKFSRGMSRPKFVEVNGFAPTDSKDWIWYMPEQLSLVRPPFNPFLERQLCVLPPSEIKLVLLKINPPLASFRTSLREQIT